MSAIDLVKTIKPTEAYSDTLLDNIAIMLQLTYRDKPPPNTFDEVKAIEFHTRYEFANFQNELAFILEHFPNLEALDTRSTTLANDDYITIAENYPRLKTLATKSNTADNPDDGITTRGIEAIARNCPDLEKLFINGHPRDPEISAGAVQALSVGCCQLKSLMLPSIAITPESTRSLSDGCPDLDFLSLEITNVTFSHHNEVEATIPNVGFSTFHKLSDSTQVALATMVAQAKSNGIDFKLYGADIPDKTLKKAETTVASKSPGNPSGGAEEPSAKQHQPTALQV